MTEWIGVNSSVMHKLDFVISQAVNVIHIRQEKEQNKILHDRGGKPFNNNGLYYHTQ